MEGPRQALQRPLNPCSPTNLGRLFRWRGQEVVGLRDPRPEPLAGFMGEEALRKAVDMIFVDEKTAPMIKDGTLRPWLPVEIIREHIAPYLWVAPGSLRAEVHAIHRAAEITVVVSSDKETYSDYFRWDVSTGILVQERYRRWGHIVSIYRPLATGEPGSVYVGRPKAGANPPHTEGARLIVAGPDGPTCLNQPSGVAELFQNGSSRFWATDEGVDPPYHYTFAPDGTLASLRPKRKQRYIARFFDNGCVSSVNYPSLKIKVSRSGRLREVNQDGGRLMIRQSASDPERPLTASLLLRGDDGRSRPYTISVGKEWRVRDVRESGPKGLQVYTHADGGVSKIVEWDADDEPALEDSVLERVPRTYEYDAQGRLVGFEYFDGRARLLKSYSIDPDQGEAVLRMMTGPRRRYVVHTMRFPFKPANPDPAPSRDEVAPPPPAQPGGPLPPHPAAKRRCSPESDAAHGARRDGPGR